MKTKTKRILNVKACALGVTLITGALLLNANVQAGSEPGEPLAMLLATPHAVDKEASGACPENERCVEWCDFANGAIHPSGTLCCVSPDLVGRSVDITFPCRRPAS